MSIKNYYLREDTNHYGQTGNYLLEVSPRPKGNKSGKYVISEASAERLINMIGRDAIGVDLDEGAIEISGCLKVGKDRQSC